MYGRDQIRQQVAVLAILGIWVRVDIFGRTGGGRIDGDSLRDFLISRAAFDTLERAKHWTAFHVAQTMDMFGLHPGNGQHSYQNTCAALAQKFVKSPHYQYSLRDVERRPVLCSFKRIEGGSAYQKKTFKKNPSLHPPLARGLTINIWSGL